MRQLPYDMRQRRRRDIAERMSVGDGSRLCSDEVKPCAGFSGIFKIQADGRHPHHAAAALTVVDRLLDTAVCACPDSGQTGDSGSPSVKQLRYIDKPRTGKGGFLIKGVSLLLRPIPILVAHGDIGRIGRHDAAQLPSCGSDEQPVCGKERHLRIVRYERLAVCQLIIRDACFAVLFKYAFL